MPELPELSNTNLGQERKGAGFIKCLLWAGHCAAFYTWHLWLQVPLLHPFRGVLAMSVITPSKGTQPCSVRRPGIDTPVYLPLGWDNSEAYFKPGVSKLVKMLGFMGYTALVLRLKSAFAVQKQPQTRLNA